MIRMVFGGDKSGKSSHALDIFGEDDMPGILLATGQAQDFSFRQQILDHRLAREAEIPVRETGVDLVPALYAAAESVHSILVDSLDFWLFACLSRGRQHYEKELVTCLEMIGSSVDITLVSCEAGLGPIPVGSEVRRFVRQLGSLNQAVASISDEVRLVVAGIPLFLKRP